MRVQGSILLGVFVAGCGASATYPKPDRHPASLRLDTVSPASIKADFQGDVVLRGQGFLPDAAVLVDDAPADYAGMSYHYVSGTEMALHVDGTALLHAGDRTISVMQYPTRPGSGAQGDAEATDPVSLHVKAILADVQHVRTLPGLFEKNGGFADFWVIPWDSDGGIIEPGTELGGTAGLGHPNFQWTDVTVTPIGTSSAVLPDYEGVADVFFEPVDLAHPLAVSLAIDQSGSIATPQNGAAASDPNDVRIDQSEAFVSRLSMMDQVEVLEFQGAGGNVPTVVPFTTDKAALRAGLETLRIGENGGTPLYDAMVKQVNDAAAKGAGFVRAAVILTDGRDNGSTNTPATAIAAARSAGIPIYTIGLGNPTDPISIDKAALQNIADQTGGRFLFAQDPTALQGVFDQLTGLLQASYQLRCAVSFNPPITTAGTYVLSGNLETTVDGETRKLSFPPINVSILN